MTTYYSMVPAFIRYDRTLTAISKLVYIELVAMCMSEPFTILSNDEIASYVGYDIRSVQRGLAQLTEEGYIHVRYEGKSRCITPTMTLESRFNAPFPNEPRDISVTPNKASIHNIIHDFDIFWTNYPKKQKKKDALKAYTKASDLHHFPAIDELIGIVAAWGVTQQWVDGYIPLASTWLNGEQWEDILPAEETDDERLARIIEESKIDRG